VKVKAVKGGKKNKYQGKGKGKENRNEGCLNPMKTDASVFNHLEWPKFRRLPWTGQSHADV
jgi:hypothetical protein